MSEMPGGLSDALRDLADGPSRPSDPAPPSERLRRPEAAEDAQTLERDQAVDIPTPGEQVRPEPIYAKSRPRGPKTYAPAQPSLGAVAAPVLVTLGLLMLIPAIWGTLLLMGIQVWRYEAPGARTIAGVMLVCYPLAGLLTLGGGFYFYQHFGAKKRREADPR